MTRLHRRLAGATLVAASAVAVPLGAQQSGGTVPPRRGFPLFATPDLAATGMRSTGAYRFLVSNAGPMDMQQGLAGLLPAQATRSGTRYTQFTEITLFAAAARGDWLRNRQVDTALGGVLGGGQAVSYNYHFAPPGVSSWTAADGSLGFDHSGIRSTSDQTCLNHTISNVPVGTTLMAGSDCPQTWGVNGWQGRRPISQASWLSVFNSDRAGFRFDFASVPLPLVDTTRFLGDRFSTYGVANDYGRERRALYGRLLQGGAGAPTAEGYPLGLEWRFDAFALNSAPGIVFWQATVTNRTSEIYEGGGLDYDSLYVGVLARHGRSNRGRAGFDVARGAALFNENGHNSTCDNARSVPGSFSFGGYTGNCPSVLGFGNGASAIVFLKSPIGDLRYKQFSDPASPFYFPASPVRGDTITYNIGHMCGDDCIQDRFQTPSSGFGVIASNEALALGGQAPAALEPFQYWQLFHPANGAAYGTAPRVDLSNPRAGGGFNFFVPPSWRYATRPSGATAAGSDTLFLDTCNPTTNSCVGVWLDTLPDRSINFTRNATWLGAGPFRLAKGQSAGFVIAIVAEGDSVSIERSVNQAISLYQTFYAAPGLAPAPRIASVNVTPGSTRVSRVRILLDNRDIGYVDPYLLTLSDKFRTAGSSPTGSVEARLNYYNPRVGPSGRTLADTIAILARSNVQQILVYKSCDAGRNFTASTSPNLCTRDRVIDSLGVDRGPAAYRSMSPDSVQFIDNNVLPGQSYYYAFVPVTRGVRLQLIDSTATTGKRALDTTLVAGTSALPAAGQPNIVNVYVPASYQAGGEPPRTHFLEEAGLRTLDSVPGTDRDTSWNGLTVTAVDSVSRPLTYRLVFGDTVVIREYATGGAVDSTVVIVRRRVPTGYNFNTGPGATGTSAVLGRYATSDTAKIGATTLPSRRSRLDTLRFVSTTPATMPVVGTAPAFVETQSGTTRVRTTTLAGVGNFVTTNTASEVVGPLPQGVLLLQRGGAWIPVLVANDFRANIMPLSAKMLSSPDYADVSVDVVNRPVVKAWTATVNGGAQRVETYYEDPASGRIRSSQPDQPTLTWQSGTSRMIGTTFGDFAVSWSGPDFGSMAPFVYNRGLAGLQQDFTISVSQRQNAGRTDTTKAVRDAINLALGTAWTSDSLISVGIPFAVRNRSSGHDLIVAMRRADKYPTYLLGTGADTGRVDVPADQWVPGEPVILLERVRLAVDSSGFVKHDAAGQPLYQDTLLVAGYRVVLGCSAAAPFTCNPLVGRGGSGFIPTSTSRVLVARYAVPYGSDRDFTFLVSPLVAGGRVARITQAQLDSVKVVPNPYVMYSNYETNPTNEQRVMFTHLPPRGVIRIYTVAGQFVQQLRWSPADLNNGGDLYFNLLTREGLEMASGLYLFTVTADDAGGGTGSRKRQQIGKFIIIR